MMNLKSKPQLHREWIDATAYDIVRILQKEGFKTYLVGGCVRDLLAGIHPKDFDIATNAEPQQIKRKIWGSYIIGRRFRLVLVRRGDSQYEVATFRREARAEDFEEASDTKQDLPPPTDMDGPGAETSATSPPAILGDNFFGTEEEDALRRDFTVNALFYDPIKEELIDYSNGLKDIEARVIRMIGDPNKRILEDPIRSLRAIRLAHKLNFTIEASFRRAIEQEADSVVKSVLPRRREEYLKFFRLKDPIPAFLELYDLGLLRTLMPSLQKLFESPERRDVFIQYVNQLGTLCLNSQQPLEIYTPLVLAFQRAMGSSVEGEDLLLKWMREELGMFKSEQASVMSILNLSESLTNYESFKKRGHRRQSAFLKQPDLPMAFRVAKFERLLPAKAEAFWSDLIS